MPVRQSASSLTLKTGIIIFKKKQPQGVSSGIGMNLSLFNPYRCPACYRWHCRYCHQSIAASSSLAHHWEIQSPLALLWCYFSPLYLCRFMPVHIWRRYWHLKLAERLAKADGWYLSKTLISIKPRHMLQSTNIQCLNWEKLVVEFLLSAILFIWYIFLGSHTVCTGWDGLIMKCNSLK